MKVKIKSYFNTIGLRSKFVIATTGVILLLGVLVTIFVNSFQTKTLTHALQGQGLSITRNISINAENLILTDDIVSLQRHINEVIKAEEDVSYIYILDPKGDVLVHTFLNGVTKALAKATTFVKDQPYSTKVIMTEDGCIRDITMPIGEIGTVHVGMSEEGIRGAVDYTTKVLILMTLVIIALGMLLVSYIVTLVLKPLGKLTMGAKEIGNGNLDYYIKVDTKDEIGTLAGNFNQMATDLKEYREKIISRNEELSDTNEELDSTVEELQATNEELDATVEELQATNEELDATVSELNALNSELEERVEERTQGLKEAQEIAHIGNWDWNMRTGEMEWSDELYRIFGFSPNEFKATYELFFSNVHQDDRVFVKNKITTDIINEKDSEVDYRIIIPDGTVKNVFAKRVVTYDNSGNPLKMSGVIQDITKLKSSEKDKDELWKQLLQSQKLESIGRLTGGIAHDFNNLLQTTIGFSTLVADEMSDDNPQKEMVLRIQNSGERAAKLINQLLVFSRRQVLNTKPIDPNEAIENILEMCSRMIGENIIINKTLEPYINKILADDTQVEQVLMNLLVNARDAMTTGGTISIETKSISVDKESIKNYPELSEGDYVEISVNDSGHGISDEVREKIFDPFFTTKDEGKGTGLGLSTVFGIVKQHNGAIYVDSKKNVGTEFRICFPVAHEEELVVEREEVCYIAGGNETILLVEDDQDVMILFAEALRSKGYNIFMSECGEDAFKTSEAYEGKIDLLLSDVILPDIGGLELYNKIVKSRPLIKTVFVSGFFGDPDILGNLKKNNIPFMKKPISPQELSSVVRQVLDTPHIDTK